MSPSASRPRFAGSLALGACLALAPVAHGQDAAPPPPAAAEEPPKDGAETPAEPVPDLGAWGVGGTEEEGRFKPSGKTGKLKELEEEHEVEAVAAARAPAALGPAGAAYLDTAFVVGSGSIVVPLQESGATQIAPTASFLIGASYRLAKRWEVGLRFGVSSAETNGPRSPIVGTRDPDSFKQIATGGLELGIAPHFQPVAGLIVPVGLALTIPTGMGDLFATVDNKAELAQAMVNEAAAAARGWEDRGLFSRDRFGVTPSAEASWEKPFGMGVLALEARTKLEILIKTGGREPDPPTGNQSTGVVNGVAFNWVLGGGAFFRMFDGLLEPGLRLWGGVSTPTDEVGTIDNGGGVFVAEPNVKTRVAFNADKTLGLDARVAITLPVAGPLASGVGTTESSVWGLRATTGLFF